MLLGILGCIMQGCVAEPEPVKRQFFAGDVANIFWPALAPGMPNPIKFYHTKTLNFSFKILS
jgi:hypothetical protein